MSDRHSFTQAVYDYLTARPGVWVNAVTLERIGGRCAWRTRVSEVRRQLHREGSGTIANKQTLVREHQAGCPALQAWDVPGACNCDRLKVFKVSEYRFEPADDAATLAVEPTGQQTWL
jgi:hypothetical protein